MAKPTNAFDYVTGIVSRIPESMKSVVKKYDVNAELDIDKARRQHEKYIHTLRKLRVDLSEMDSDEDHPYCCFMDDLAVVRDGIAVLTRPGDPCRRGEVSCCLVTRV